MQVLNAQVKTVSGMGEHLTLVSDSQDVQAIKDHIGELAQGYDTFFVEVLDGDYGEVWGMCGIVPRLSNLVTRLDTATLAS